MEFFNCSECGKSSNSKQQVFENDHCGHRLCELCRLIQETKCRACLNGTTERPLQTVEQSNLLGSSNNVKEEYCNTFLQTVKKRNSVKSYQHIIAVEGNLGMYRCTICNRETKKQNISYHFACISDKKPLSCDQCEKTFVKKSHLECHRFTHLGIKPFKCTKCPSAFTQRDKLKRHEQIHSDERCFCCDTCSKRFKVKGDLKKHMLTHSEVRNFKCDVCLSSYKERKKLAIHKLKHTGTKNFTCEICGKNYLLSWLLTAHRMRHRQKKHFKCNSCGKRFFTKQILNRHQTTHTEIYDFECSICNKEFKRKDNLERHMKNLHLEPPDPTSTRFKFPAKLKDKIKAAKNNADLVNKESTVAASSSETSCTQQAAQALSVASHQTVIVRPEQLKDNVETPKACAVSVIVGPQKAETGKEKSTKHLPYRILPPDKRFLQMNEIKNFTSNFKSLKATHIVTTSDTGEPNIQTIVMTDDKNHTGEKPELYTIDARAELCKKVSKGKYDKMNKCFRVISHTDTLLNSVGQQFL